MNHLRRLRRKRPEHAVCRHCGAVITRGSDGFWRDETPDPGDGHGGDADCGPRFDDPDFVRTGRTVHEPL